MGLLTSIIQNHIEEKHRDEDLRKANLRQMYGKIAFDPDPSVSDDHREEARQNLSKLLNPEAKKSLLQKAGPLFDHLLGVSRGLPTPDSSQSGAPQTGQDSVTLASPAGGGSMTVQNRLPTPAPVQFPVPSIGTNAERLAASRAVEESEHNIWKQRAKEDLGPNADPRDLAEYAGSKGQRLATKPQPGTRRAEQWKLPDGSTVDVDFDSKAGHRYDAKGEEWDVPEGATRVGKSVNLQLAWFKYPDDKEGDAPHAVRVDPRDPSKQLDQATNKPVPQGATQINTALVEAKVRQNSYGQYGNLYRALVGQGYSDPEASKIAGEQVEAEYQKKLSLMGAGLIHEAMGQNAAGDSIGVPLLSTKVPSPIASVPPPATHAAPIVPAVAPPAAQSAPAGLPASPGATAVPATVAPQAAPVIPPVGHPSPVAPPVASLPPVGSLGPRKLPGVSAASAKQAQQFGIPITGATVQIFGDPNQPDLHPLISFADLADDDAASKRIGKAIELTLGGFGDKIGEASVGGGAGPVSVSSGGFGTWLQNALNLPATIAGQKADMIRDAMKAMKPREQEAYNAVMSTLSTMAGLRSISKMSAAMGSLKLIENELPKVFNVAGKGQFLDQLQKVGGEINNVITTPGIFPRVTEGGQEKYVGIAPEMRDRIKALPGEIQALKSNKLTTPNGPKKEVSQAEVDAYAKKFNLSAADAKKHVEANGFTVK